MRDGDIGSLSLDFKAEKKLPATLLYRQKALMNQMY